LNGFFGGYPNMIADDFLEHSDKQSNKRAWGNNLRSAREKYENSNGKSSFQAIYLYQIGYIVHGCFRPPNLWFTHVSGLFSIFISFIPAILGFCFLSEFLLRPPKR